MGTVVAANSSYQDLGHVSPSHQPLSPHELYPLVAILAVFSVTGTVGNAIAFYVFSTLNKQKLTSTIFILALAGTDFLTCLITIPFTITMEILDFKVQVDFFCKFYHFLITTTVPFSAFVMVGIAVDRYLCICHPFLHWMTPRRAKIIIACLAVFIFCIGAVICLHYSIYQESQAQLDIFAEDDVSSGSVVGSLSKGGGGVGGVGGGAVRYNTTAAVVSPLPSAHSTLHHQQHHSDHRQHPDNHNHHHHRNYSNISTFTLTPRSGSGSGLTSAGNLTFVTLAAGGGVGGIGQGAGRRKKVPETLFQTVTMKKQCDRRENTINEHFFDAMQRIYSGFFLVSCVAVLVLYSLIYHSVVTQRRKKLKIGKDDNCCFFWGRGGGGIFGGSGFCVCGGCSGGGSGDGDGGGGGGGERAGLANGDSSEMSALGLELTQVNGGKNAKEKATERNQQNHHQHHPHHHGDVAAAATAGTACTIRTTAVAPTTTTTTTIANTTTTSTKAITTVNAAAPASSNGGRSTAASVRASLSRARLERMRLANIKTALMLFVVTLVFIFSFLPSWLIALKVIRASVMVFYMYFVYNVVNPIIYAFMNHNFRTELKKLFGCRQ